MTTQVPMGPGPVDDRRRLARVAAVVFGAAAAALGIQVAMTRLRPGVPGVPMLAAELAPFWFVRAVLALAAWRLAALVLGRRLPLRRALPAHLVGAAAYWVAWSGLVALSPLLPPGYNGTYATRALLLMQASSVISPIIYACLVGSCHALHYLGAARRAEVRAAELEARLAQARLDTLRAQLNPHFLFNTLNGITGLALQRDHDRVVAALGLLGDLLRSALSNGDLTTLEREVAVAGQYLELQRMRLGDRLEVVWDTEPDIGRCRVPALMLQPLLENALVHGIEPLPGGGRVGVRAGRRGSRLLIEVSDSGPRGAAAPRFGTGLRAVEARLQHAFGDDYRLAFGVGDAPGTTCVIEIPFDTDDQDPDR